MSNLSNNSNVIQGTAAGTIFMMLQWVRIDELMKTIILSATGIVVSYTISAIIEKIKRHGRKPGGNPESNIK